VQFGGNMGISCVWTGVSCSRCDIYSEETGACVNTCAPPPDCPADRGRALGACTAATDPGSCAAVFGRDAGYFGGNGGASGASCFWAGSACRLCNASYGYGDACINTCAATPACAGDPERSIAACGTRTDDASCNATFGKDIDGTAAACFWNGYYCHR